VLIALNQTIATPDVYIAYCIRVLVWVEIIRLLWLMLGFGPHVYDKPRPEPLVPIVIWDWADEGGWPA
jgi:hypothetical protein